MALSAHANAPAPSWLTGRAGRVADHTQPLPADGAAFVDQMLARYAGKISSGQVERLCEEALVRFDPEAADAKRRAAMDGRHFDVHLDRAGHDGTVDRDAVVLVAGHNIAPACHGHHRAKTHGGWVYRFLGPGAYLWVSPHGCWFHVDGTGTLDLGHQGPAGARFGDPPHP